MKSPAEAGFERLKTLQGDWIDVDGVFGEKGKVAVTYRVTGGGNTIVETFPVGTPFEMMTVYHKDGAGLALTHFCAGGTQPRMTSKGLDGQRARLRLRRRHEHRSEQHEPHALGAARIHLCRRIQGHLAELERRQARRPGPQLPGRQEEVGLAARSAQHALA